MEGNKADLDKLKLLMNFKKNPMIPLEESYQKGLKNYLEVCKKGMLIFPPSPPINNPKISIVVPMYNEENNILTILRSIQNQTLREIEIVCVNDFSTDKTKKMLEDFQKQDPRITIINNKKNRGVIYSRIYGALHSKGEYVTFLDADDALCNLKILEKAYEASKKDGEKIDIVHYQSCACALEKGGGFGDFVLFFTFNPNNFNKVIKGKEIGDNYMQKKNDITGSALVFDKIYSRKLILKMADYIGEDVWNQHLIFCDDFLEAYAAMKNAESIINLSEIGYWHLLDTGVSATSNVWEFEGYKLKNPESTNKKLGDYMIVKEKLLELTNNEPDSLEFRESQLRDLENELYLSALARSVHFDKYIFLCEKFMKWKYITKESKDRMKNFVKLVLSHKVDSSKKFAHLLEN